MAEWGANLPEGPVAIMFTDVAGSTALRTTLGDDEANRLFRAHDELVRAQISEHQGHDQSAALGDGFLAVFTSTRRAVSAAVGIQRSLDAFNRTRSGSGIGVRIGLNTGEVSWQDGQPFGEAVHAASRVCSAAEAGQILVSDVTRQLAGTVPDLSFVDAGEHDLKGFPQPWRLWEAVWVREARQTPKQVFVARDREMGMLRARLADALDGRGSFVMVGGEPGVGKTTLVRELIREAESRGALALFGRCYEIEGALPYSPFVEMLGKALSLLPADMVLEDMGDDAPEVARMVPEIRSRFPDIPAPLELPPEQQRRYFLNAVGAYVGRSAKRFPLLLVMDDVHWADVPTLLMIEYMGELVPNMRVLGIGTYRDVELDVTRPLAATLDRMVRARTVDRLSVKRFDRSDVAGMLHALAAQQPPDRLVDVIFDETEGNPFFVEEVFRHLFEEGRIFDEEGCIRTDVSVDELDVPESVRLVVGRRLDRLGENARKALAAAAVVGRGFSFSLLESITDLDAAQLLDVVDAAEAARVIVPEERAGQIHYTFAHELIRQTLLTSLSMVRRQRLHLAVADAMERLHADTTDFRPSEVAAHLLQAGSAAETDRTVHYLELAADQAIEAAAFEDALSAVDSALTIVGDRDPLRRIQLRERQGEAVRSLGRFDECLEIWSEVLDVYAAAGETAKAGDLCAERGYQLVWLNRFTEAFAEFARGLDIVGEDATPTRALLLASIGQLTCFAGWYEPGIEQLREAEELARGFDDDRLMGRVLWGHNISEWSFARCGPAVDAGQQSVGFLRTARDEWGLADALCWLALPLCAMGDLAAGEAAAQEGLHLSVRLGNIGGELLAGRALALVQGPRTGDLAALKTAVEHNLELCLKLQSPWSSQSCSWLSDVETQLGLLDDGLAHADEAIATEPDSAWSGFGWASRLSNRAFAGDRDTVEWMIADKLGDLRTVSGLPVAMGRLAMLTTACTASALLDLDEVAGELYPAIASVADAVVTQPFSFALTQRTAGMAAAASKQWDRAQEHFDIALAQAGSVPNRLDEPLLQYAYAKMLLDGGDAGDPARVVELLDASVAGSRRNGSVSREQLALQLRATL